MQAEMELPLTFADYGLIGQDAYGGQQRSQVGAHLLAMANCSAS